LKAATISPREDRCRNAASESCSGDVRVHHD
jgi:hypothetical protein